MTLRFSFTTDHHFSHRPPGRRQGDYFQDLTGKMNQVITYCSSTGSIPLFGGDLFHLKDPAKIATPNLMKFLGGMLDLITKFPRAPLTAIGNHDIQNNRLSTLPGQPLGIMADAGAVQLLTTSDPDNLQDWQAPSGFIYSVNKVLPGEIISTEVGSHVFVYSTPYIDDPQDLLAYLRSDLFHDALGKFVAAKIPTSTGNRSVTGVLLLHTLSGPVDGEFFGLFRASYPAIHSALARSALGRATSAVLFGHEHPEMGDYMMPIDQSPLEINNLPSACYLATQGTIYINPASFARSALDFDESASDPDRPVYMVDLIYTPSGLSLSLETLKVPLVTRPLEQLFGYSAEDPLNQEGDTIVPVVETMEAPKVEFTWNSFSDALAQIDQVAANPDDFIKKRLQSEPPEVITTVRRLL